MRAEVIGLLLGAVLFAGPASAYDVNDPNNCSGVEWDDKRIVAVAKVTAQPRVNFVKSPYDDDFTAEGCPAATKACRMKSYLVTGDLVLVGKTQGDFTCISYKSPQSKKQIWTTAWLPSAALTPVAPMASPKKSDWIGTWCHPGCSIDIESGQGDKLHIEGVMLVQAAREVRNGTFEADVAPESDTIAFGDGYDDGCRVRMQRVGSWLLVQDNRACGGYGVTFTGLYRRKK